MHPSSGAVTARFTAPSGTDLAGSALSFNPSGSSSTNSLSSATWDWGDGTQPTFNSGSSSLNSASHTYATGGTYTVTLTLVDNHGTTATSTQTITVYPIASFTETTSGLTVNVDGSGSSRARRDDQRLRMELR